MRGVTLNWEGATCLHHIASIRTSEGRVPMVNLSFSVFGPALAVCVVAVVEEFSEAGCRVFLSGNSRGLQEGTVMGHLTAGSSGFKALGTSSSSLLCTRYDAVSNYTFSAGTWSHLVHMTAEARGGLRYQSKLNLNNLNLRFKYFKKFYRISISCMLFGVTNRLGCFSVYLVMN